MHDEEYTRKLNNLSNIAERMIKATAAMERVLALSKLSDKNHPYHSLVRVMCKLKFIKNWPM